MLGNYPSRIGRAGRQSHLDGHIWQLVFIQIGQRLNPAKVKKKLSLTEWNGGCGHRVVKSRWADENRIGVVGDWLYLRVVPAETV